MNMRKNHWGCNHDDFGISESNHIYGDLYVGPCCNRRNRREIIAMIKTNFGTTTISGEKSEIIADFAVITHVLIHEVEEISVEDLDDAYESAKRPKEEIHKEAADVLERLLDEILKEVKNDGKETR